MSIVVVDRTDGWSPATGILLAAQLRRVAERAETEERLVLVAFDGSANALSVPAFDRCKPPATGSLLTETPQRIARDHAEKFSAPLMQALESVAKPSSASRTELVAMIGHLAAKARLDAPTSVITVHVFSDMEENAAAFSFTRKPAQSVDVFAAHFAAQIGNRLKDITLNIRVLPPVGSSARPNPRPNPLIERAWRAAFARHDIRFTWEPL